MPRNRANYFSLKGAPPDATAGSLSLRLGHTFCVHDVTSLSDEATILGNNQSLGQGRWQP